MTSSGIINHDDARAKDFAVRRWRGLTLLACAVVAGLGLTPARA